MAAAVAAAEASGLTWYRHGRNDKSRDHDLGEDVERGAFHAVDAFMSDERHTLGRRSVGFRSEVVISPRRGRVHDNPF